VVKGYGLAKKLGYPTLNLDNPLILKNRERGVYLSRLKIFSREYFGLLYYGPRLVFNEKKDILEIYVIGFAKNIYGSTVKFQVLKYLRGIKSFKNTDELKKQIALDFQTASNLIK